MPKFHQKLERSSLGFTLMILLAASVGGIVEIAPLFTIENTVEKVEGMRPYTPLEQAGRDIYIREGCYACHSQMIRTLRSDVDRYGHFSLAAESMFDHPFQWGSKRTGPDLSRIGGKYSDDWHVAHLKAPREFVQGSVMPGYPFLAETRLETNDLEDRLRALSRAGVPYSDEQIANAERDAFAQADPDAVFESELMDAYGDNVQVRDFDGDPRNVTEMDALVAYLQMLGTLVDTEALAAEEVIR